mmetsp:Transcript_27969/g.23132  ORF Transcript_27969/g.23132 Transcript_27969/m.23132 type:complete len:108 (+) Transcript_27969:178-501(+)
MGLVLPGMDDAKSFTMRQDVLVAKDGQVVVQASPNHPYQYLVFADTAAHSQTLQLFNKKSFPVHHQAHDQQESSAEGYDAEWSSISYAEYTCWRASSTVRSSCNSSQ